jgi:hypothetical protein
MGAKKDPKEMRSSENYGVYHKYFVASSINYLAQSYI